MKAKSDGDSEAPVTETGPARLSGAEVDRELNAIHTWVNHWMDGDRVRDGWQASPGSPLAGDDRRTFPYQTSHTAHAALNVALDHLHALTFVTAEHHTLHLNAPFSLACAAIENAAIAYWLVSPARRQERVMRTLRLHAADVRDATNAKADLGAKALVGLEARMAKLKALATASGIADTGKGWPKFTSTEAVTAVDRALENGIKPGALGAWRLFSGMAHARPWATAAFLDREVTPIDGRISKIRRINTPARVLFAASMAQDVFALAARTYDERARAAHEASRRPNGGA